MEGRLVCTENTGALLASHLIQCRCSQLVYLSSEWVRVGGLLIIHQSDSQNKDTNKQQQQQKANAKSFFLNLLTHQVNIVLP